MEEKVTWKRKFFSNRVEARGDLCIKRFLEICGKTSTFAPLSMAKGHWFRSSAG